MQGRSSAAGPIATLPVMAILLAGFVAPLLYVAALSLMPPRTFTLDGAPTLANYATAIQDGYVLPLLWSLGFALLTTILTLLISWPIAKAVVRRPGAFATTVAILIALPIFISESVRLFGASLFMMPRGGILAGSVQALTGFQIGSVLYTKTATLIGLVYIHLPFTLFPMILGLALAPKEQLDAAFDLGASPWQTFREVELPIALPGVLIGALLTFVLAFGANSEAAILGGQSVVVIAKAIEQRFTYAQDWPLGSSLTVAVAAITALAVFPAMRRLDLNRFLKR
ncbi:MAG: ABC transporter permease [Pseudomonadota bacterium]|nr:ABC transporter permease [Pseudomonadota bacterium]